MPRRELERERKKAKNDEDKRERITGRPQIRKTRKRNNEEEKRRDANKRHAENLEIGCRRKIWRK